KARSCPRPPNPPLPAAAEILLRLYLGQNRRTVSGPPSFASHTSADRCRSQSCVRRKRRVDTPGAAQVPAVVSVSNRVSLLVYPLESVAWGKAHFCSSLTRLRSC